MLPDALDVKPKGPPPKKAAVSQKQQMVLMFVFVGVVLAGLLTLILWTPSKKKSTTGTSAATEATPAEIRELIQSLEQDDPELARMLQSFAEDWKASGADKNASVAEKLRSAQHATLSSKLRDRSAAARRAEILAMEMGKLAGEPSLKALKQSAGK